MAGKRQRGPTSFPKSDGKRSIPSDKSLQGRKRRKGNAGRPTLIPVPNSTRPGEDEDEVDEGDVAFFASNSNGAGFLRNLDQKAISLSAAEIKRLHRLDRPKKKPSEPAHVPHLDSDDDDDWSSTFESLNEEDINDVESISRSDATPESSDRDSASEEDEDQIRPQAVTWQPEKPLGPARLPVKLADGTIRLTGNRPAAPEPEHSESSDEEKEPPWAADDHTFGGSRDDAATGARFGRPGVMDILSIESRKAKIQRVKEDLATLCQDIIRDPENSLGFLRRLQTYTEEFVSSPSQPKPIPNDPVIRKLALLSQLAVFKDIIPGYRIRVLTDAEKAQQVSQAVQRQRDFEQGLLASYQQYLKTLEKVVKEKSDLVEVGLQSMCTILTDLTHFNYRVNIMNSVVAYLSKKSWDKNSAMCLESIISVFRNDRFGTPSLELVRLLNRMIKERHFRVHPNVLSCLLHLRLKSELQGVRASHTQASLKERAPKKPPHKLTKKQQKVAKPYISKNARKAQREVKEIEAEMAEAEAEVDEEERVTQQTETLKLLFVLYFSIIKNPRPTRLLSGALEGISRYAHLVNIDFFRDLLGVLKSLSLRHQEEALGVGRENNRGWEENDLPKESTARYKELLRRRLLCITTAFELLSGQGEAITIDLDDFINQLYVIALELSTHCDIEEVPAPKMPSPVSSSSSSKPIPSKVETKSISDLLFRTLYLVFNPRISTKNIPPWRTAAFAKRLLISSLSWPSASVLRALEFVETLLVKEPRLEALLSTDDRTADGVYRGELDDPQVCNAFASVFWEVRMLEASHWDGKVREEARRIANYKRR